jgi:hypothetical protein
MQQMRPFSFDQNERDATLNPRTVYQAVVGGPEALP